MGYKIIDDNTAPFIQDHNGDTLLQNGLATWSEGNDSTEGIKATKAGDPNTFYTDNRIFMRLLSNDLNLMFNLDRTIYVSKKGINNGMVQDSSGNAKILHFNSITNALNASVDEGICPKFITNNNNINLWSNNDLIEYTGLNILVGPGTYTETNLFTTICGSGSGIKPILHICGYGNDTHITNLDWNVTADNSNRKLLLLENIVFDSINNGKLNAPITFKNVYVDKNWSTDYFELTNCNKFNGEISFKDAKAVFTGTKYWTLYRNTSGKQGVGTYFENKEKQYIGESTL